MRVYPGDALRRRRSVHAAHRRGAGGGRAVLHLGLRTRRIPVSELLSFDVPEKDAGGKDGPVIVSFREGGQERRLALLSVEDREEALARLRALLSEKKK